MTRRGVGLLAATLVTWGAARTFGADDLHTAADAAALLLIAAVVWVAAPQRLAAGLRISPAVQTVGGTVDVQLEVRNRGALPTPALTARIAVGHGAGATVVRVPPLTPRARADVSSSLTAARRGVHEVGPVEVVRADPFGLATRRRRLPATAQLTVTPHIVRLAAHLRTTGDAHGEGATGRRSGSAGADVVEIRGYQPGDELRAVHWPSTAHRGELMIRRIEEPHTPQAAVFLDTRRTAFAGAEGEHRFETAVAAGASICLHLLEHGVEVALVGVGQPGPGADERDRLLHHFAALEPRASSLQGALGEIAHRAAGTATFAAVLVPLDAEQLTALEQATRRASQRVAVIIDDAEAERDTRAERTAATLRSAGWLTTVLEVDGDLAAAWQRLAAPRSVVG